MAKVRLGMVFQDISGSVGGRVVAHTRSGLTVRQKARYKFPSTPDFKASSDRLRQAMSAWATFTAEQASEWKAYAETLQKFDRITGVTYSPTGKNAFTGLAVKYLQVNPEGQIPQEPPATDFGGEDWRPSATAQTGAVVFLAPEPNSEDTTTELLLQKLLNVRRSPSKQYKHAAFHAFEESLQFELPLEPGVYAFAYRFVRTTTGQTSMLMPLGVFVVE